MGPPIFVAKHAKRQSSLAAVTWANGWKVRYYTCPLKEKGLEVFAKEPLPYYRGQCIILMREILFVR